MSTLPAKVFAQLSAINSCPVRYGSFEDAERGLNPMMPGDRGYVSAPVEVHFTVVPKVSILKVAKKKKRKG